MKLGLVFSFLNPEIKMLISAAEAKGVQLEKVIDASITMRLDSLHSTEAKAKDYSFDTALMRSVSFSRNLYLSKYLETNGVHCINSHAVQSVCGDKALTTLALARAGIPMPKTFLAFTHEGAMKAVESVNYPAVLKPVVGSWGRLLAKVNDKEAAQAVLEHKEELGSYMHKIYYVQEYIDKPGRDIRAIIMGDELVCAYYRKAAEGSWLTNIAQGGTGEAFKASSELVELCLKSSKAVGGGVLGIDVLESERGLLLNEVNHGVEFKGAHAATGVDIAGKMIVYAVRHSKS